MKLLGLTGGVGMGKSTAAKILVERGVPIMDSDELARRIVEPGEPALAEIRQTFGDAVIGPDGRLRRDVLARVVFSDPAARQKLEAITHPRIGVLWKKQAESWRGGQVPVACVAIPLLFEIGAEKEFDATVCVACSPATQQGRLRDRGWTDEQIRQRIAAQLPVEKKIARATYVIWSEGGLDVLRAQIERVLSR